MSDNYEMTGAPTSRARPPALYAHDESRQHAVLIMHYNTSVSSFLQLHLTQIKWVHVPT